MKHDPVELSTSQHGRRRGDSIKALEPRGESLLSINIIVLPSQWALPLICGVRGKWQWMMASWLILKWSFFPLCLSILAMTFTLQRPTQQKRKKWNKGDMHVEREMGEGGCRCNLKSSPRGFLFLFCCLLAFLYTMECCPPSPKQIQ